MAAAVQPIPVRPFLEHMATSSSDSSDGENAKHVRRVVGGQGCGEGQRTITLPPPSSSPWPPPSPSPVHVLHHLGDRAAARLPHRSHMERHDGQALHTLEPRDEAGGDDPDEATVGILHPNRDFFDHHNASPNHLDFQPGEAGEPRVSRSIKVRSRESDHFIVNFVCLGGGGFARFGQRKVSVVDTRTPPPRHRPTRRPPRTQHCRRRSLQPPRTPPPHRPPRTQLPRRRSRQPPRTLSTAARSSCAGMPELLSPGCPLGGCDAIPSALPRRVPRARTCV